MLSGIKKSSNFVFLSMNVNNPLPKAVIYDHYYNILMALLLKFKPILEFAIFI